MDVALELLFWFSIASLVYIYAGYPLLVWMLGRLRRRPVLREPRTTTVSVVLVIHNEAARIHRKLDSLLAMHGAEQIVEILIGSDGSTDDSAAVVQSYPDPRVKWIPFTERRGKPSVINDLVPQATGNLVLLTDVRQDFDRDFLTAALPNFADVSVGVVSGELVFQADESTTTTGEGIGLYWRYEKFIRNAESRFRGVPGATGACYLIRRKLFRPIRSSTILDDVAIPLQIVSQGYRCLFERGAMAYDRPSAATRQEAIRKRRTIAGAAQLMVRVRIAQTRAADVAGMVGDRIGIECAALASRCVCRAVHRAVRLLCRRGDWMDIPDRGKTIQPVRTIPDVPHAEHHDSPSVMGCDVVTVSGDVDKNGGVRKCRMRKAE
jgi:poly-beta-1,6-N-acetyl-D-glucosamine synthase